MDIGSLLFLGLVTATPAIAQDRDVGERAAVLADDLASCRGITADGERLACFDRTSAALVAARDAGNLVVLDREGMRSAKRAVFGFSLPKIRLFGDRERARPEPEVQELESVLTSVAPARGGFYTFVLADQSQWQTTESRMNLFPTAGKSIKIEAGLLGSYNASIDGKRAIRVKRIR